MTGKSDRTNSFLKTRYCRHFVLFLLVLMTSVVNAEPAWQPSPGSKLEETKGRFAFHAGKNDPQLITRDLPKSRGPFTLAFAMKSRGEGEVHLYWATPEQPEFGEKQTTRLTAVHNDVWHDYRAELPVQDALTSLRIDPCGGEGDVEIAGMRLLDSRGIVVKAWLPEMTTRPRGDAVIRGQHGDSEIVITTTSRLAGAIHSLTWKGQEFIDSFDHGRQLQSACSFGDAKGPFHAECFNPTEAGSRMDGSGEISSSRLLNLTVTQNALQTTSQAAFWLAPWEKSEGKPAINRESLSNHLIIKTVRIGREGMPGVIGYDVTFRVPVGERHTFAQFEALTGYMPARFEKFYTFDSSTGKLAALDDGPGEQPLPIVFSTRDGSHAMGIFAPTPRDARFGKPSYGRFRFDAERVVKWNSVFRLRDDEGISPGDYSFEQFVAVGDLEVVTETMRKLAEEFR